MCGFRVGSCTGFELNSIDRSDRNSCKLFEREQWCGVCVCGGYGSGVQGERS